MTASARWVVVCLFLVPGAAFGQSTTTGAIGGVVRDATGALLPGVTVEASSPALIEKTRSAVTDGNGSYKIIELRPGTYTVTFSLPSFATVKREGLELTTGFTATVNADMKVGDLQETITVTGASPVVDIQNVRQQTVLSKELWEALPTAQALQGYVALTLGATMVSGVNQDVGGTKGEGTGNAVFTFHGTDIRASRRTIEGLNMSDAGTRGGAGVQRTFHNQLSVHETTIQTAGASAEAETGGVWINMVPRDGGNRFGGQFVANGSHPSLQGTNLTPELVARGVPTPGSLKQLYDVGGALGGPIRRDRLWFYGSPRWWGAQNFAPGNFYNKTHGTFIYTPDLSRPAYTDLPHHNDTVRLTWQVAAKHKIATLSEVQENCQCFFFVDRGTHSPEAAANRHQSFPQTQLHLVTWTYPRTNRLLFEAGNSALFFFGSTNTVSEGVTATDIPLRDLNTGYAWGAPDSYSRTDIPGRQLFLNQRVSMSYVTGSHAFKVGWNVLEQDSWDGGSLSNNTPYGPVRLEFRGGVNGVPPVPVQIVQFLSPTGRDTALEGRDGSIVVIGGLFAQDQWNIRRVTLNLGLRFDTLRGRVRPTRTAANQFVGAQDFPGVDDVPSWKDLAPRIGAAFDVFGNGKTALKGSIGRYVQSEYANTTNANRPDNLIASSATRSWTDVNRDLVPNCVLTNPQANGECGRMSNVSLGLPTAPTTFYDPDYLRGFGVRWYSWQGDVTVQHELRPGVALNGGYYRTSYGNFTVSDNRAITPADHDPFCVTAPVDSQLGSVSGSQICGLYDVSLAKFGQVNNFITSAAAYGKQTSMYQGADVSINARIPGGGVIQGGVGTGRTVDDVCFVVDSPGALRFCRTVNPWKNQTQIKVSGHFPLPWWGLQASGVFQNLPGPTHGANRVYTRAEVAPALGRNLSGASVSVPLVAPFTLFEPRFTQVDVRLMKDIRFGRTRLRGQVDIYNVFNANPVLALNSTYGPTWRRPIGILDPRMVKLGVQVDF